MTNKEYVEMYQSVLSGGSWGKSFFDVSFSQKVSAILTYLFKDMLQVQSYEQAKLMLTDSFIKQYKLEEIAKRVKVPEMLPGEYYHLAWYVWPEYKMSADELTLKVYHDLLAGKRKTFPNKYFCKSIDPEHKASLCFDYLCREVLKLDDAGILKTFGTSSGIQILTKYKLKIALNIVFDSLPQMLLATYPHIYDIAGKE